jgi:hypothetical protein
MKLCVLSRLTVQRPIHLGKADNLIGVLRPIHKLLRQKPTSKSGEVHESLAPTTEHLFALKTYGCGACRHPNPDVVQSVLRSVGSVLHIMYSYDIILVRATVMSSHQGSRVKPMKFRTEDLPLAAFICATRKLPFVGCESINGNARIAFVFEDATGEGEQLQVQFESGAECSAVAFYDSIRHLRRVMTRAGINGVRNNEYIGH